MTSFFDNQIDLFDLYSAVPEPAYTNSADPKTSADSNKTIANKVK